MQSGAYSRGYSVDFKGRKCNLHSFFLFPLENIVTLGVPWVVPRIVGGTERPITSFFTLERELTGCNKN